MRKGLALVVFTLVALPAPAYAHAAYKTSDPPNRSKVASAPASLWAEFTEPLASGSYLQVFDPCGDRVDNGDTEISGYRMSITQDSTRSGVYTVRFRALSTLDPHEVNGSFTFTVTGGELCPGADDEREPEPAPQEKTDTDGDAQVDQPVEVVADDSEQGNVSAAAAAKDGPRDKRDEKARAGRADRDRTPKTKVLAQRRDREEPGLFEGIPLGSFAISLAISALIGAAGGKVYAGIMGPRA